MNINYLPWSTLVIVFSILVPLGCSRQEPTTHAYVPYRPEIEITNDVVWKIGDQNCRIHSVGIQIAEGSARGNLLVVRVINDGAPNVELADIARTALTNGFFQRASEINTRSQRAPLREAIAIDDVRKDTSRLRTGYIGRMEVFDVQKLR